MHTGSCQRGQRTEGLALQVWVAAVVLHCHQDISAGSEMKKKEKKEVSVSIKSRDKNTL